MSEILGRVELDGVDREMIGAFAASTGAVNRDEEAIGCFDAVADEVLIVEELGVGLDDVDVVVTAVLVVEALAGTESLEGNLGVDVAVVDGLAVETTVLGLTEAEVVVRGFASSDDMAVGAMVVDPVGSVGREIPASLVVVIRAVAAAVLRSGTVDEVAVFVCFVAVEVVVLRGATAGSATFGSTAVRTVGFRAVVGVAAIDVEACALAVVRLAAGTVRFTGTASTSLAFPLPVTAVVVLLFVVLSCGSGSETLNIRSISLANISSSFSTSTFLPLVTVALDVVRVVRGVASSGFDAERVARRVGISSTPSAFVYDCG